MIIQENITQEFGQVDNIRVLIGDKEVINIRPIQKIMPHKVQLSYEEKVPGFQRCFQIRVGI